MRARKGFALLLVGLLGLVLSTSVGAVQRRSYILAIDTTSTFTADSSSIVFTGDCERLYLLLKPDRRCRVAIQVRSHGDSTTNTPGILADTSQTSVFNWITAVASGDTLSTSAVAGNPVVTNGGYNEYIVNFPENGNAATGKWGGPRGMIIPLRGTSGEWYWGPNTSIRLRVLGPSPSGLITWKAVLQGVTF